jgi:subtilisin
MASPTTLETPSPQPTGRKLAFFKPDSNFAAVKEVVHKTMKINTFNSLEFEGNTEKMSSALASGDAVYVERFRVAAIKPATVGVSMAALQAEDSVIQVRPEFYMFAIGELQQRYATWAREELRILAESFTVPLRLNPHPRGRRRPVGGSVCRH